MSFYIREGIPVQVEVKPEKRVRIGCNYQPPKPNHVSYDMLWLQDLYLIGRTPWSYIRYKTPEFVYWFLVWCVATYFLARFGVGYLK